MRRLGGANTLLHNETTKIMTVFLCSSVLQWHQKIVNLLSWQEQRKKRADKYDTKLAINGTFEDVMKVSVTPLRELKEEKKKS